LNGYKTKPFYFEVTGNLLGYQFFFVRTEKSQKTLKDFGNRFLSVIPEPKLSSGLCGRVLPLFLLICIFSIIDLTSGDSYIFENSFDSRFAGTGLY